MTEQMSTLQERMALAISRWETQKGKKFKNTLLAAHVKTSKQNVGHWVNGPTQKLEGNFLIRVADFFEVDQSWLAGNSVPMINRLGKLDNSADIKNSTNIEGRSIPVISWADAKTWTGIDAVPEGTIFQEYLPYSEKCGDRGYALIVEGISMLPKFEPNDRIYVNSNVENLSFKTNDVIIVSCIDNPEVIFKKLIIETGKKYLQALNPSWPEPIMELTLDCKIVGKVVGLYREV